MEAQSPLAGAVGSVSPDEIGRFGQLAGRWWDRTGPMRALHQMNPLRIGWTDDRLAPLRQQRGNRALRVLDLGCGAGIASEALAALGHEVLGVDASEDAIAAAKAHAALHAMPSSLGYRAGTAEALAAEGRRFDAVVALEVIEHVPDQPGFVRLLAELLEPDGVLVVSTLNRTLRSLAAAKLGAEYLLRLLPVGTHAWRRFVTPVELSRHAAAAGLRTVDSAGMVPNLRGTPGRWRESADLSVNYIAAFSV